MRKFIIRIFLILFFLGIFIYYIIKNMGVIESTMSVTTSQSVGYLIFAIIFSLLAYFFLISMHQRAFGMLKIVRTRMELFFLQIESVAMNVMIPTAGVSAGMIYAADAKKRGDSEAAAVTAMILTLLVDYISIVIILIVAILYLFSVGSLTYQIMVPAVIFFAITFGLYSLIYFSGKNKPLLKKFLDWTKEKVNNLYNKLFKKQLLKRETIVDEFIGELEETYLALRSDKKDFYVSLSYMLLLHLCYLIAIYILFLSFGVEPTYRVLITGYAIGKMVVVISPSPNGVGFVEGAMALTYTSMGVPATAAVAVTLIYRGLYFWLPFLAGFIAVQKKHLLGLVEMD